MPINRRSLRICFAILCSTPFIAFGAAILRPLRVAGVYQTVGVFLFTVISFAAWTLGGRAIRSDIESERQSSLAGMLLLAPFAIVSLLWVGIGGPWAATPAENQMRYLVLVLMVVLTTVGFVMLREALSDAGERFYSTLGFAAVILAGPIYVVWDTFVFGAYFAKEQNAEIPPAIVSLRPFQGMLLAVAGALTYFATAAYAASLSRVGWLGRKASFAYIILSVIASSLLVILIMEHPDPSAESQTWYTIPGLILLIPALPLIIPSLLGAVLLRRAGNDEERKYLPDNA